MIEVIDEVAMPGELYDEKNQILPAELLQLVFAHLSISELAVMALVCRYFLANARRCEESVFQNLITHNQRIQMRSFLLSSKQLFFSFDERIRRHLAEKANLFFFLSGMGKKQDQMKKNLSER